MMSIQSVLIAFAFAVLSFQGGTGYKVQTRYPVPGNGGFDYIILDSSARRLYVSHGTEVNVVNPDDGKLIGTIADTPGVHGIAIAGEFKHGFTSNGSEKKVSMFDPETLRLIKKIEVGKGPDGIYYDPATRRVFTNNHGSHDITVINAESGFDSDTVSKKGAAVADERKARGKSIVGRFRALPLILWNDARVLGLTLGQLAVQSRDLFLLRVQLCQESIQLALDLVRRRAELPQRHRHGPEGRGV